MVGLGLARGAAGAVQVAGLANYRVTVKRTWSDGSIKHAIVTGRAPLTANTPLSLNITVGTPPSGGVALTSASIAAAAPNASIQCGAIGTVALASLLSSPVRTWVSNPEMVECHYRGQVGTSNLSAWFHVRLFADGRVWARAIVENGYLDNGAGAVAANTSSSYVPKVVIGATTVYDNGGAALTHHANTRWSADGWIGGNPAITAMPDVTFLRASKLVPGYGFTAPSAGTLASIEQSYSPMAQGSIVAAMSNSGASSHLGLLPLWDALFCTSGDVRAYRAVMANSSAINSRAIVWRGRATNGIPTPSAFPTWSIYGPGGGGEKELSRGGLQWEYHHDVNEGYLAYLLTGDYWHYETLAMQAANKYFFLSSARGSGTARKFQHDEIRGIAWSLRTVGSYTALAPDGDAEAASFRSWLDIGGFQHWRSKGPNGAGGNQLGYPLGLSTYDETKPLAQAPWQMNFWIATNGFVWDIEPGFADPTPHRALRDWMYKGIVGMFGGNGTNSYCYTAASNYNITISPNVKANFSYTEPAEFYATWGEVFAATSGSANTACGATLGGGSAGAPTAAATGYWGVAMAALAYAVEHGATDASAAYARLTSATNWSAVRDSGFDNWPIFGLLPRT